MFELRHISLINWYLFAAEDIPVQGNIAIIGPNGSGKSSVLDAVQMVLTGHNRRYLRLNASAGGEASKRKIRDYCLGLVSDPKEGGRPVRESSVTYIALTFRHTATDAVCSIGIAMTADLQHDEEQVESLFIAPGLALTTEDFVERTLEGPRPRLWPAIRDDFRTRSNDFDEPKGGQFVAHMLRALSMGSYAANQTHFLRNFRNAITFVPISNPTDFVRSYILEPNTINVQRFRDSIAIYNSITGKIKELEEQLTLLGQSEKKFRQFRQHLEKLHRARWIAERARWDHLTGQSRSLEVKQRDHEQRLAWLNKELARIDLGVAALREERDQKRAVLGSSDVAVRLGRIDNELSRAEIKLAESLKPLSDCRTLVRDSLSLLELRPVLEPAMASKLDALFQQEDEGLALVNWPRNPRALEECLSSLSSLDEVARKFDARHIAALTAKAEAEKERDELKRQTRSLESGRSPLSHRTEELMGDLAEMGLSPEPLCALVDVIDEKWRFVIESILGPAREALILPPDQAKRGLEYLRTRRRHFAGCLIVNTTKSDSVPTDFGSRSLSTMIRTDNPHARAFINLRLGGIVMVKTEAELMKENRAVTADGLYANAMTIEARRDIDMEKLGRTAGGRILRSLQGRLEQADAAIAGLERDAKLARAIWQASEKVARRLADRPLSVPELRHAYDEALDTIARLRDDRLAVEAKQDKTLQDEVGRLARDIRELEDETRQLRAEHSQITSDRGGVMNELAGIYARLPDARRALTAARAEVVLPDAKALYRQERADKAKTLQAIETLFRQEYEALQKTRASYETAARGSLRDYCQRYSLSLPFDDAVDPALLEAWIFQQMDRIRNHALLEHKGQAEHAEAELNEAFREDFVARLRDSFLGVEERLSELNRQLAHRAFHGETYQFRKDKDARYADIIDVVNEAANNPLSLSPLFASVATEDSALARGMRLIKALIAEDGADAGDFEDYRNYFTFDIVMTSESGRRSTLSSRIGTGSGGEKQTPFYVSIGAGLATTYHGRARRTAAEERGLSLALFDEAFNKLDTANIANCIEFMSSAGLQVFLAAPDEKRHLFMERMDTIISIYRADETVVLDVEHPGEKAKKLLADANPYNRGIDAFRETIPAAE